ncbi:MAG TPA: plastocyanin/azurin family copper-binding protein [Acidobacteriota bacterium]|nr:plastocyanin/azurin family copper-binding protein [Acidobacteriota bacterium]
MKSKLIVLVVLVFAACVLAASNQPTEVKPVPVKMDGFRFTPQKITIERGTTVEWTNIGKETHTVTDEHGAWDSGDLETGKSFSHRFDEPGTFAYYCVPHRDNGMTGTIIVK